MKTIEFEGKKYEVEDVACQHCGNNCEIVIDKIFGPVSDCHGCGIGFENDGNTIFINEDLSYCDSWDE
jgi:hypothetical protein